MSCPRTIEGAGVVLSGNGCDAEAQIKEALLTNITSGKHLFR
jgi:hypothetical protein